jgi:hypothetical protein
MKCLDWLMSIIDAVRRSRNCSYVLLCLIAFTTRAATAEDPAERMRALIVADEQSAKPSPDRWPDLSREGCANGKRWTAPHSTNCRL